MSKLAERQISANEVPQYLEPGQPSATVTITEASDYLRAYNDIFSRPTFVEQYQRNHFDFWANRLYDESRVFGNPEFVFTSMAFHQLMLTNSNIVIALMFERLDREPVLWTTVLPVVTGENPVKRRHEGHVRKMVRDWRDWGRQRGYL